MQHNNLKGPASYIISNIIWGVTLMGLIIKTFSGILNSMVNWMKSNNSQITNFSVGSVSRTLLESVAVEMESAYYQMYKGFNSSIESSIYNSFDFFKYPATSGTGLVTLHFKTPLTQPITLQKGFQFYTIPISNNTLYFEVIDDVTFTVGASIVQVLVQCTKTGVVGNIPEGTLQNSVIKLTEVFLITNEESFYDGRVGETVEELRKRFSKFISTLSKGTANSVQYGCFLVNGVTGAIVDEKIGYTNVYVHDVNGDLPQALHDAVVESILEYRPAGIPVNILPVVKRSVDLSVLVYLNEDFDKAAYQPALLSSLQSFLNGFTVSKELVESELIKYMMNIDQNAIYDINISPSGNVLVDKNELIRAGNITLTIV